MPPVTGLVGLLSGLVATKVMDLVTTVMYNAQSQADKDREKQAQSKPAFVVAAERTLGLFGVRLTEKSAQSWGSSFHWALGATGGAVYVILRAVTEWGPPALALAVGLGMFLIVDEAMNWVFGFSAPPDKYPLATHARGLVGHVAYGAAIAGVAEATFGVLGIRF
jgi:xanthosine utilization system XapX-like protein